MPRLPSPPNVDDLSYLPPHEPTPVPGFHAYSTAMSRAPGETLDVRVSNDGPVNIAIVRHGRTTKESTPVANVGDHIEARLHPVHRGSYVRIDGAIEPSEAITLECWFRPLIESPDAGLLGDGSIQLRWSNRRAAFTIHTAQGEIDIACNELALKQWHHAVGILDGKTARLFINGEDVGEAVVVSPRALPPLPSPRMPGEGRGEGLHSSSGHATLLGAMLSTKGEASAFYTGDLYLPCVYNRALPASLVKKRHRTKADRPAPGCVGCWRFDAVRSKPYRDVSPRKRHGRPVNYPIRMIPGPRRVDDCDWATYDPLADETFGFAVRFMGDALLDCRWPVSATWKLPADLPTGQYAARVTNAKGESRDVDFIVRPAKPRARLMCLSTTNTRVAYNFQPFGDATLDYGAYQNHPHYPMFGHLLGQRRPRTGEPWQRTTVEFELPFYAWLDAQGIAYDLYAEWDLDENPALLDRYDAVAFAGHSEYWTAETYESLLAFVKRGGHLLSMSGNTAFWRVSVDRKNSVVEVRKHERQPIPGTTYDPALFSAHHHQLDHTFGTIMRRSGWPEWNLTLGITGGFTNPPLDGPRAGYTVLAPRHALFQSPRKIETADGFAPDAAGYETDVSLRSMNTLYGGLRMPRYATRDGTPEPETNPEFDKGQTVLARAYLPGNSYVFDQNCQHFLGPMYAEMMVREREGYGVVFAAGSVLSSHILEKDANFSAFMLNVLDRMGIKPGAAK